MGGLKRALYDLYSSTLGSYAVELRKAIGACACVLDVGCGEKSPIHPFSDQLDATGVEGFEPSLNISKKLGIHKNYIRLELLDIGKKIAENSYDCVLCLDVIEHFEKEESKKFIKVLEKIARKRVVLSTPNGFVPQGAVGGNEFQVHRCGWEVEELESLGYSITGVHGHKAFRGELASYKIKPSILGKLISDATQPFVRNNPKKAFSLLAVKNIQCNS